MEMEAAIVVDQLTKRFGNFTAVDAISFTVRRGEIFGFLGPNGSGKSTTVKMLCRLLKPTSGAAIVSNIDIATGNRKLLYRIGYMSQKFSLYDDLKVIENLRLYAGMYSLRGADRAERIEWAIELAGLHGRTSELVGNLSAGWKQRLALTSALLHRPEVLFLDEPTSGVDPITRRRFWTLINDLAHQGITVLVTTHYMDEAEYCNRIVLIGHGRIVASGAPGELKRDAFKGALLAVQCEPIQVGRQLLESLPEVTQVAAFGNGLHVVIEQHSLDAASIEAALRGGGLNNVAVQMITPSLEDVFVQRLARTEGALTGFEP